jgi:hypothetical protein
MRTAFFILIVSLYTVVYSQDKMNKLSVSPIQLIGYNRLNIEFERGFNNGKYGCALYLGQTGNASRLIHNQYSTLSEQNVAFKFYGKSIDRSCFWYGGLVSVTSGNLYSKDKTESSTNISSLGLQATGGYQFFIQSFYANLYVSSGYSVTNNLFGSATFNDNWDCPSHIILAYGIKAGFKF